jgi:AcrR family transcriptional regulator
MAARRPSKEPSTRVPPVLRRLWGLGAPSQLGRPAELDVRKVVEQAVDLADSEGLDAVSLPRVARELGYSTMALYRHVGSKDELLVLMQDHAAGEPPPGATGPWRPMLRTWAVAQRDLLRQRPWIARLAVSGPPAGPRQIAWMESGLRALAQTKLRWPEKIGVLTLLSGYVRHSTLLALDLGGGRERSRRASEAAERHYGRTMAALVDAGRYPETAKLLASGVFERPPARQDSQADPDFDFGLERILDGVEAVVEPRKSGKSAKSADRSSA